MNRAEDFSRGDFMRLAAGAFFMGGTQFLESCGRSQNVMTAGTIPSVVNGQQDISHGADLGPNAQAQRLNPPPKGPRMFLPWEPGETIDSVPNDEGKIALRIDDGPWRGSTTELDNILVAHDMRGIPAFALILQNLLANPELGIELAKYYEIINHSVTHRYGDQINAPEIEPANKGIQSVVGVTPGIYACPGLGQGSHITAELRRLGMCATTTKDLFIGDTDSPPRGKDELIAKARAQIRAGRDLIVHGDTASHEATRQALPYIIDNARTDGFTWVSTRDWLHLRYNDDGTRKPEYPVLRVERESQGLSDRHADVASFCCDRVRQS